MQYTKEQYQSILASWRSTEQHSAAQHVIYNVLRGKDPMRGFTPIKNPNKVVSNCNDEWFGYHNACNVANTTYTFYNRPSMWRRIDGELKKIESNPAEVQAKCEAEFLAKFGVPLTDEIREILKEARNAT